MKKNIIIILFAALAVIQLSVPAYMIIKKEGVIREGTLVKFKTMPVDPFDAFRGKYVQLGIEGSTNIFCQEVLRAGQNVYAIVEIDEDGFAKISKVSSIEPGTGVFFKTKVHYYWEKGKVSISVPFDRYYMNEELAPLAESAYRKNNTRATKEKTAYITVKIKDGDAVLTELYIADKPIKEFLKDYKSAK